MKHKASLLLTPAILMALLLTGSLSLLSMHFQGVLFTAYETKLKQVASITARVLKDDALLHGDNHLEYQMLAKDIGNSAAMRVTIIDRNGQVVGDTEIAKHDLKNAENHSSRPEVQEAMTQGEGLSRRFSSSLGYELLYYAITVQLPKKTIQKTHLHDHDVLPSENAGSTGSEAFEQLVVRTSLPLNIFDQKILWIWFWVAGISALGVMVVILISLLFSRMLARQAASERATLEAQVKERTHELALMQRLGSLMSACTTLDSAAGVVHPISRQLLPECKSGAITLIKSSRNRLDLLTQWGEPWKGTDRFDPVDCWSLLKGHSHLSIEDDLEIRCAHSSNEDSCQICIPLVAQGETLGVLHLCYANQKGMMANHDKAEAMAEQIGLALANMRLREDLKQQAIRDPLTGMFNRRHMMENLEQKLYSSGDKKNPLSLMMIDLDHFKRFNDTFGHDAGDYVLKQVAILLKQNTREEDLVCRYGGEEICIVCPNTSHKEALEMGKRLVMNIAGQGMVFNGQSLGSITISMGLATYFQSDCSAEVLIKEADHALYEAKEKGRNRVVSAGETIEDQRLDD